MVRVSVARKRRSGSVMVWLIVCLGVVVAVLALGMDGGRMMEERRRAQSAADDAAYAAATDLYFNYNQNQGTDPQGTAKAAALGSAATNGYSNDGTTSIVTVNIPPQSGAFAGKSEFIEVIIQSNLQGSFSAAFTSGTLPVKARAVARGRPLPIGLLLLGSGNVISLSGSASVNVTGPLAISSNDSQAISLSGGSSVTVSDLYLTGSLPSGNITVSGSINPNGSAIPDPLSTLPIPSAGSPGPSINVSGCNAVTVQPGTYGSVSATGSGSITMMPGTYIVYGLQASGSGSIRGNGVTIINMSGSIDLSGSGSVVLTPPTTGTYQGLSIIQPSSDASSMKLSGSGSVQISGTVYTPAATIQLSGSGTDSTKNGSYIAAGVQISGSARFSVSQGTIQPLIPQIQLVE